MSEEEYLSIDEQISRTEDEIKKKNRELEELKKKKKREVRYIG